MESPLQCAPNKVFTFSVVSASPLEVVQVLCQYLQQEGCSECRASGVVEKPFMWQKIVTNFVDFVPISVELKVVEEEGNIVVKVKDLSLNDVIRCTRLCNDMCKFVNGKGLRTTSEHQLPSCFRLLDDDFDMIIENEMHAWKEQVDIDSVDIDACKGLLEEELQMVSCWSASKTASHGSLATGLAKSATTLSALVHMASLVDSHPSVASLRNFVV
jgi:hypothetical protein